MALAVVVAVGGFASAFGPSVAQAGIRALAWSAGFQIAFDYFEFHLDRIVARGVRVANTAGEPIADVGSLAVTYSLRDLLPGGSHAYGLTGFDVERARIFILRHQDGTLNVPIPKLGGTAQPLPAPFVFRGRVRDVSVDVDDRAQGVVSARHLAVRGIDGDFDVDTKARSRYRVDLAYVENGQRFPVEGRGDVDPASGFGSQRWRARQLPIGRLVDAAMNSPSFHVVGGSLYGVDARIVGLSRADGSFAQHVSATATIDRARIGIGGLIKPLRDVSGDIAVYGDGLLLQDVGATIAGVPIRLGGGVYHLAAPALRLTVSGDGNLRDLRGVLAQTAALPLAGRARLDVAVEGSPSKPLTLIALRSPRMTYAGVPLEQPAASIAFDGQEVNVVDARTTYAGVALLARGRLNVHTKRNALEMVAGLEAPAEALPYVGSVLPGMPIRASILASGDRPALADVRGIVFGNTARTSLAGTFDVRSDGVGTIGPLRIDGAGESLYASGTVNRPHKRADAYLTARGLRVDDRTAGHLPGLSVGTLPPFAATVNATIGATARNGLLQTSGVATLANVRTPAGTISRASVRFAGAPQRPIVAVLGAAGISPLDAVAGATLSYDGGTLRVRDAAAASQGTFVDAHGNVTGISERRPRYDLAADVHSADVARLADFFEPQNAMPVEGTLEGRLRVTGAGSVPALSGTVALPEGAVNYLAFHQLSASIAGSPRAIALQNGRVEVGSSALAFNANLAARAQRATVSASAVDLQDFNDFFDPGDMLAGKGRVHATVALRDRRIAATAGTLGLQSAAVRGFQLGDVDARWNGPAGRIETAVALGGASGRLSAAGTVGLDGGVNLSARARNVSLAQWLPAAGFSTVPVTGVARADATISGRYPNVNAHVETSVADGTFGHVPIEQLDGVVSMQGGRGRLIRSTLIVPHARVDGSGTFGLRPHDPLGLSFHATSENVAALARTLFARTIDTAGSLDTTLRVSGTRVRPVLDDDFVLATARYGNSHSPRRRAPARRFTDAALSSGEIDLTKIRLLAEASVPITLMPFAIVERGRAVSASLTADDVEASNLLDLLPKGTTVAGRVDGRVALAGTIALPRLDGNLDLAGGHFAGPQESVPIRGVAGRLAFAGETAYLQSLRARAGGGTLTGEGQVTIPNLRRLRDVLHRSMCRHEPCASICRSTSKDRLTATCTLGENRRHARSWADRWRRPTLGSH